MKSSIAAFTLLCGSIALSPAVAGPYTNAGISSGDPAIVGWADGVVSFAPSTSGSAVSNASLGLGVADGSFVSLGDLNATQLGNGDSSGKIVLSFSQPITNGPGYDLAVFENAFAFSTAPFVFGELAFVEVSSNGVNFARFPSVSLNVEDTNPAGTADTKLLVTFGRAFAGLNPTNTHNLAGIHPNFDSVNNTPAIGTQFDLDDLLTDPLVTGGQVDLHHIGFVRLIDIPGFVRPITIPGGDPFLDSQGHPILDTWPTASTGGFDLDAVAALHAVPEPSGFWLAALGASLIVWRSLRARRIVSAAY